MTADPNEITEDINARLERLKQRVPSMRPAARRRLARQIKAIRTGIAKHQATASVDKFIHATRNGSRGTHIEDAALPNLTVDAPHAPGKDRTGGRRRPAGYLRGVPWYEDEDGAAW